MSYPKQFSVGESPIFEAQVRDLDGDLVAASSAAVYVSRSTVEKPETEEELAAVVQVGTQTPATAVTGIYTVSVDLTDPGFWHILWKFTGDNVSEQEITIEAVDTVSQP